MTNSKIIQFPKKSDANTEPIVDSDYFGAEKFDLLALLKSIEQIKKEKGE